MAKKIPLLSKGLRFRLWIIIILASLFLMFSSLSGTFISYLAKHGIKTGEKGILAVGMVVILFISISGLILLEKNFQGNLKQSAEKKDNFSQTLVQRDADRLQKVLEDKLDNLQKKLDLVSQNTHSISDDNETLARLAAKDGLTGLYNHAYIKERMKQELFRSQMYKHSMSLLMIDVDNFKSINDTFGHAFGDTVLKTVATLMKQNLRPTDIIGRYGGEEFLIILANAKNQDARLIAERLRITIESHSFEMLPTPAEAFTVSVSIGGCTYPDHGQTVEELAAYADESLYIAKRKGKNRVIVSQQYCIS
jgi:diguanylate cyclase (GGDEF)-like protein